jgi:hypothetical protein
MGIFGWSYPPGAANDPYAPYNQTGGICEVCGYGDTKCVCPECPKCGETGNPACYGGEPGHEMLKSRVQEIGYAKRQIQELKERIAEHERFLAFAEGTKKPEEDW